MIETQGSPSVTRWSCCAKGTFLSCRRGSLRQSTVPKLPPPVTFGADDQALLNQVIGYYHESLEGERRGSDYLKAAASTHPEAIERFQLGFANRTLGLRLPEKNRKAGEAIRGQLERIGSCVSRATSTSRARSSSPSSMKRATSLRSTAARSRDACAPGRRLPPLSPGSASRRVERGGARGSKE